MKKRWYDDWEAGWKIEEGKKVYYFKLPNGRSDSTLIQFKEGCHNFEELKALHSFAESALYELTKK